MADQADTKTNETRTDAPRAVEAATKAVAETVKAAAPKAATSKASPARGRKPARKQATARKAQQARKAVRRIAKPARAGANAIKTGVKTMNTQTRKTAEAGFMAAEQIKTFATDASNRTKSAMEKSAQVIEQLADMGRGNVEALVASSKVAAKGVESLSQHAANYSRTRFEEATAAFRNMADIRSATDFFKMQGDFARGAFDSAIAESARMSESMLKLAGDVAEPLTSRYAVAAERVKTLAA